MKNLSAPFLVNTQQDFHDEQKKIQQFHTAHFTRYTKTDLTCYNGILNSYGKYITENLLLNPSQQIEASKTFETMDHFSAV